MSAYYNDSDAAACDWLEELIRRGFIAPGIVDRRSILEVEPADLAGFTQCHFFAGIGGWSYALRLAGWHDDRPVWTGSPPCQPFSAAGRQKGQDDERHLAPHFAELVAACRPPVLFGEQVASAAVLGRAARKAEHGAGGAAEWAWLDDLFDRLEAASYTCAAADLPAAGVGAPHIRQRTFFGAARMADANCPGPQQGGAAAAPTRHRDTAISDGSDGRLVDTRGEGPLPGTQRGVHSGQKGTGSRNGESERPSSAGRLADSLGPRLEGHCGDGNDLHEPGRHRTDAARSASPEGAIGRMADADSDQHDRSRVVGPSGWSQYSDGGATGRLANTDGGELQGVTVLRGAERDGEDTGRAQGSGEPRSCGEVLGLADADGNRCDQARQRESATRGDGSLRNRSAAEGEPATGPVNGFWGTADWLFCRDGKWRPVEPGTFPMADGIPARVGRLRGYGNAIVPQAAAAFVTAFLEALEGVQ